MTDPIVITEPTVEPLTVEELKAHLRVDTADEDALIEAYLIESREYFEARTRRSLHEKTLEYFLDGFPCGPVYLPFASPLISVTGVWYKNSAGTETEWTGFVVDTNSEVGSVRPAYGQSYPSYTPYPVNSVRIRYKAGIANQSPQIYPKQTIIGAIRLLAAGRYENREAEVIPGRQVMDTIAIRYGAETLISMNQVIWAF